MSAQVIVPTNPIVRPEENKIDNRVNGLRRAMFDMQNALKRSRKNVESLAQIFNTPDFTPKKKNGKKN